jgi:LmbE family N-acetylglucosaminyl deacetylase
MKNVVILNAHPDDGTAAVATIDRIYHSTPGKYDFHWIVFSRAVESIPEGYPDDAVANECYNGVGLLSIRNCKIFDYPVRRLDEHRQEILEHLVKLNKTLQPEIIFLPSSMDIHQDHKVVFEEGIRAFRRTGNLYGYDFPWNTIGCNLNRFIEISEDNLKKRIRVSACYKSQIIKENNCLTEEYIRAQAIERGNRINVRYAEAFEVIREVVHIGD